MTWLILTLSCIILWGITDILYKKSSNYNDSLSHYKTFVWIGIIMAPAGVIMAICSDTLSDSIMMVKDNLYLIPLCVFYAIALFFGLIGIKHLDASVVSPLENIDGAIAAIILYFYFLFAGYSNVTDRIGGMDMIATVLIVVGVVLLGIQEQTLSKQEAHLAEDKKRHRLGALALIFPIIYNLVDAVSMVATGITVSGETEVTIPDIDFFIFESLGFITVAAFMWLYMLIVKKYKYNPFKKRRIGSMRCRCRRDLWYDDIYFCGRKQSNTYSAHHVILLYCNYHTGADFLKRTINKKTVSELGVFSYRHCLAWNF